MSEAAVIELTAMLESQPPQPSAQDWYQQALCPQTDPGAFFPEQGGSTKEAKKICLGCPVRERCLQWALDNDERFGVWGGLSERERRRLKRGLDIRRTQDDQRGDVAAITATNGCDQHARLAG